VTANEEEVKAFVNEINVYSSVGHHANVVSFIGCCTSLGKGQ